MSETDERARPTIATANRTMVGDAMSKVIPVVEAQTRATTAGTIELKAVGLDGREVVLAFMPDFTDQICGMLQRVRADLSSAPIAIEKLPGSARKLLRAMQEDAPLPSGGFRVYADGARSVVFLEVHSPRGAVAEIPLDLDYARRLIDHLSKGIALATAGEGEPVQ